MNLYLFKRLLLVKLSYDQKVPIGPEKKCFFWKLKSCAGQVSPSSFHFGNLNIFGIVEYRLSSLVSFEMPRRICYIDCFAFRFAFSSLICRLLFDDSFKKRSLIPNQSFQSDVSQSSTPCPNFIVDWLVLTLVSTGVTKCGSHYLS